MPKITKVRITNASYNDGNRLIADELYDFANKEGNTALNTLINLENGGGKSVLVQLMMQPIVPKAKVAGRKLESFFKKISDHCYVILEWKLDGSPEHLMTGISIAAREIASSEDSTSGGMGVKYYTFCATYREESSKYSILNLPLSQREHSRFIPADFDTIRMLSRKSGGNLTYYSSDDSVKWQKALAQYGILQSEWRMIERLNSVEGGLEKFFENFKTSDQLIDKLLIPTIEQKLRQSSENEDASLATMMLGYARQYARQKSRLIEKENYESFQSQLYSIQPTANALWEKNEQVSKAVSLLFALDSALMQCAGKLDDQQTCKQQETAALDEKICKIQWEQISAEYYTHLHALESAEKGLSEQTKHLDSITQSLEGCKQAIAAEECANYYEQIVSHKSNISSFQEILRQKQTGSEASREISIWGYSAACAIQEANQELIPKLESQEEEASNIQEDLTQHNHLLTENQEALEKAKASYNQLQGQSHYLQEETDRIVKSLHLDLYRRLDMTYGREDIEAVEADSRKQQQELVKALQNTKDLLNTKGERLSAIPQEIADLEFKSQSSRHTLKQLQESLTQYAEAEESIKKICIEHTLDFSRRFSNYIRDCLQEISEKIEVSYGNTLRKIALKEEEIKAAQQGTLHVPSGVIQYLNATNVPYSTCEKYLLDLVEDHKLSQETCTEILKNYPAAAYGILMTTQHITDFFSYGREKWLPAMVPIFTYEQMEQILRNEKHFSGAIAFYSQEYFQDKSHYIAHLQMERTELEKKRSLLEQQRKHVESQLKIVETFTYDCTWADAQKAQIAQIAEDLEKWNSCIAALNEEKTDIKEIITQLNSQMTDTQAQLQSVEGTLQKISDIYERIDSEEKLQAQVYEQKQHQDAIEQQTAEDLKIVEELQQKLAQLQIALQNDNEQKRALAEALVEVENCQASERRSGSWQELLNRYRKQLQNATAEISILQERIQSEQTQLKQCETELFKRELPEECYIHIQYSPQNERSLRQQEKVLTAELPSVQKEVSLANAEKVRASTLLQQSEKKLRPYGEALPPSQIGADFEKRIESAIIQKRALASEIEKCRKAAQTVREERARLSGTLEKLTPPESPSTITLKEDYTLQCRDAQLDLQEKQKQRSELERQISQHLQHIRDFFHEKDLNLQNAADCMLSLLQNKTRGDRYFTLITHIESDIENADKAISEIDTYLKEFEHTRHDLIVHCTLQGQQIYEGLQQMAASSKVTVHEGKPKKHMIRFEFPEEVDRVIAENAISCEIDKGVKELATLIESGASESELRKAAEKNVGSTRLLRKYIQKDLIPVKAYKIDQNPENSGYRLWKDTQVNNSGAEKFVVYFAVILSLINYARGNLGFAEDKERSSALILDNPFGTTSSKHILTPMFDIAKHFRVQLICLSHIDRTDMVNCFDIVIKAIIKRRPLSNKELLTHEGNELIEHGFYRAEQLSLL